MYFLLNVSDADRIRSRRSCLTGQHAAAIRPLRKEFIEGAGASYDRKAARSLQMTRGTPKVFTKQMARRQYASAGSYEATLPGLPWPAQRASGRDCRGEWPPRDRAALPRLCAALTRPRLGSPAKSPGPSGARESGGVSGSPRWPLLPCRLLVGLQAWAGRGGARGFTNRESSCRGHRRTQRGQATLRPEHEGLFDSVRGAWAGRRCRSERNIRGDS